MPSFHSVLLQGLGRLERSTGLDQLAVSQSKSLSRTGVWTVFTILRALGRAPIRIYVGAEGHRVVGTASEVLLPNSGYVLGVATDAPMRGHGVATTLLERTHLYARQQGKRWTALDVEADNETAIRVYRRLDYEEAARFGWYVGPIPPVGLVHDGGAVLAGRSQAREVSEWVGALLPPLVRDSIPPGGRMLSHLELVVRFPGAPTATWTLGALDQTKAVVRATYAEMVKTGYVIPFTAPPSAGGDTIASALAPAVEWIRSLGGTRIVVVAPESGDQWGAVLSGLGLTKEVSTLLMVRPSDAAESRN